MASPAYSLLLLATTTVLLSSLPPPTFAGFGVELHVPTNPLQWAASLELPSNPPNAGSGTQKPDKQRPAAGLVSFTSGRGHYKHMTREFLLSHSRVAQHPRGGSLRLGQRAGAVRTALVQRPARQLQHHPLSGSLWGEHVLGHRLGLEGLRRGAQLGAREHIFYNRTTNSCNPNRTCGHFTQIVWNSTMRVGCARVECYAGGVIITCNYDPPGNYISESPFQ